jgi:class 3 adenylate cyclase
MTALQVGRSKSASIVLEDKSVSRVHAELVRGDDGRYRVIDCRSSYGTYVQRDGEWKRIESASVALDDPIMLGRHATTVRMLLDRLGRSGPRTASPNKGQDYSTVRRLAAILAADIVGYSRMMGEDEGGTLAALKSCRSELFDPTVERYRGRIFKVIGDGILSEFASVVDGIRCAMHLQTAIARRRFGHGDGKPLIFRMGLNIGDVIAEGDDIYGDGVNIAARLESLADPGGLCISGPVYDQVKNKVDAGFTDIGEQTVKNIKEPVRVYKVVRTVSGRVIPG